METFKVPLRNWVSQDQTKNEIKRRFVSGGWGVGFNTHSHHAQPIIASRVLCVPPSNVQRNFLETYVVQATGERIHEGIIDNMCAANGQSLPTSYLHLSHHSPVLAIWLADVPKQVRSPRWAPQSAVLTTAW